MKVLLKIGHQEFLLANDQGLSTLARTLSKSRKASFDYKSYYGENLERILKITGGAPEVSIKYLDPKIETIDETLPLGLPEFGTRQD